MVYALHKYACTHDKSVGAGAIILTPARLVNPIAREEKSIRTKAELALDDMFYFADEHEVWAKIIAIEPLTPAIAREFLTNAEATVAEFENENCTIRVRYGYKIWRILKNLGEAVACTPSGAKPKNYDDYGYRKAF